jgi:putative spermidine/putrescine transport system substrate-binding protein
MKNVITKTLVAGAISTAMLAGAAQAAVTLVSWGGGYSASQQKAYIDTYSSGNVNMISYNGGLGEVRAQVESGNVQWDIVDVLPSQARTGCDEGLFEELDRSLFLPSPDGVAMDDDLLVDVPNDCVVPHIWWSYVPFHLGSAFEGEQPSTINDFFDLEKFPGKRGVHTWGNGIVEMALYASGVAIEDIYDVLDTQEGQDMVFAKLDTIKDSVVFWSAGAKPLDLVNSGEVSMSIAYNGRIGGAVLADGADYVTVWDGQVLEEEWLVLMNGAPNRAQAIHFLIHASSTQAQADQAHWINYAPMRPSALPIMAANEPWFNPGLATEANIMEHMPTTDEHMKGGILANPDWWADNGQAVNDRYAAWMAN